MLNKKIIAFDADDTLWQNEHLFRDAEAVFIDMLSEYEDKDFIAKLLYEVELKNMPEYGFGVMAFTLSMIEAAIRIAGDRLKVKIIEDIQNLGRTLLYNPATPFEGIVDILQYLKSKDYILYLLTKGELNTQENKIKRSGLAIYFDYIEVMSDKQVANYRSILDANNIDVEDFIMIGNSFKSDISPVLELGASAIYMPSKYIWQLEEQQEYESDRLKKVKNIDELYDYIKKNL